MQAEIGMGHLRAKKHPELPAATTAREKGIEYSSSEPPEGTKPANTRVSDFSPPEL